ncbi:hypothetical protein HISP_09610 [Haloarcula hispanica N601]|uniref:Uncharacterized protein n=3 Tax=Haloarcula hispanica TaxID=51589 RepID=V5TMR1_HALHI|nr:DUF6517 family protein [Haloarcula hispanica]AEM57483.1 conserved hypothetical protein [Haloarcula hispanica ATCC 33960]AHB66247.1 hypothetical protein HISP_09610 [Haloarcula hispanica N601]MCJ0619167.1 hypothetical protein [Haloarcula hispanica]RYJ09687.1 hypothetical protein ELS20_06445 [Haloarcula hispanica]
MRKGILTLLVGLLVASSGCVGLITGETVEFDSAPASVGDSALEETGYEQSMADEQTIERTVTVAGQERTIRVTNHVRQYERGIDLGPLGEVNAGRFIVFSTPSASVAGKSLNPAASWSNERLVEEVASRNDQINDVQFERNRSVEALGESREVAVFSGTTSIEGQEVDVLIHLTSFEHEGDVVVAVAVYPERIDDREGPRVDTLLGGLSHSGN